LNADKTDESFGIVGVSLGVTFKSFWFTRKQIKAKVDYETYFFLRGFLR
jgi:hypothetical protein